MFRLPHTTDQLYMFREFRVGIISGKAVVPATTLRVKAVRDSNRFQQCGFTASVFTDKECHRMGKTDFIYPGDRFNLTQITKSIDAIPVYAYSSQQ